MGITEHNYLIMDLELTRSFLPEGYTVPDKAKQFMSLEQGDNNLRVLSEPALGWIVFTEENKPVRKKFINGNNNFTKEELIEIKAKKNEKGHIIDAKHFWMILVWDVKNNAPKILEITQSTIHKKLAAYYKDEDWGDLRTYNINITREGTSMNDTKYDVIAKPKKPFSNEIKDFMKAAEENNLIDLEAIWDGGYPFEIYNW